MQININPSNVDLEFKKASKYLPVRLTTTQFERYGECMVIVANRADGMMTDIIETNQSEIFITLMNRSLYDVIKNKIMNMDYWTLNNHYNTYNGLADGVPRKIHLDGYVF